MTLEISNKIRDGRAVGTEYVVTRRNEGNSGIIARFDTRPEAVAYITEIAHRERVYAADDRRIAAHEAEWYGTFGTES